MTPETKELIQSTLPKGWEIVEDKKYIGSKEDLVWSVTGGLWVKCYSPMVLSPTQWKQGYRYARKIKVMWTAEPPTEPGDYFWKKPSGETIIVHVVETSGSLSGFYFYGTMHEENLEYMGGLYYSIPIQPPIEGE